MRPSRDVTAASSPYFVLTSAVSHLASVSWLYTLRISGILVSVSFEDECYVPTSLGSVVEVNGRGRVSLRLNPSSLKLTRLSIHVRSRIDSIAWTIIRVKMWYSAVTLTASLSSRCIKLVGTRVIIIVLDRDVIVTSPLHFIPRRSHSAFVFSKYLSRLKKKYITVVTRIIACAVKCSWFCVKI